jgi:hypothetical protein
MRSASWWIEWPAGPIRSGVVFLVGTALVAVVVAYPRVLDDLGDDASRNSALSYSDREIAGGNGLVADQTAVYAARGVIPEDETYRVDVGTGFTGGSDLTPAYVASYYRYLLLPRRPAEDAPWIVCYGCDLSRFAKADVVWKDENGISIARVER